MQRINHEPNRIPMYQMDAFKVAFIPNLSVVSMEWAAYATLQQIQVAANNALDLLLRNRAKILLNDQLACSTGLYFEESNWVSEEWYPKMFEAGLRYYIAIVPKPLLKEFPKFRKEGEMGGVHYKYFDNREDANVYIQRINPH